MLGQAKLGRLEIPQHTEIGRVYLILDFRRRQVAQLYLDGQSHGSLSVLELQDVTSRLLLAMYLADFQKNWWSV